jgi:hypothetical protein
MATYKYFPELEREFNTYWSNRGELTVDQLKLPARVSNSQLLNNDSVFGLLFNDDFSNESYKYKFTVINTNSLEAPIRDRVYSTGSIISTYLSTGDMAGMNIFQFSESDINMFDCLLEYRNDNEPDLTGFDYISLSTISKLIYIYLTMKISRNFTYLMYDQIISYESNILENLYEIYVVNESYKTIKTWGTL